MLCSNSIDSLERKSPSSSPSSFVSCSSSDKCISSSSPYLYKGLLPIPILSFIDDINKVAKCGLDSLELNIYITKQIEMKRLNLNVGNANKTSKCQRLHIGKTKKASNCIPLYARNKILDHAIEITYLGDLVHGSWQHSK